jgi:hypothetical protein
VLPSFIRIICRIPIKNGIFDNNWRLLSILKNTNSSPKSLSDIISKSGINDVSRKVICYTVKDCSTNMTSPVAGKCSVGNVDISLFSQPESAAISLGCVVAKKAVYHFHIGIAMADGASISSLPNSFIVNKVTIFQQNLIGRIGK